MSFRRQINIIRNDIRQGKRINPCLQSKEQGIKRSLSIIKQMLIFHLLIKKSSDYSLQLQGSNKPSDSHLIAL